MQPWQSYFPTIPWCTPRPVVSSCPCICCMSSLSTGPTYPSLKLTSRVMSSSNPFPHPSLGCLPLLCVSVALSSHLQNHNNFPSIPPRSTRAGAVALIFSSLERALYLALNSQSLHKNLNEKEGIFGLQVKDDGVTDPALERSNEILLRSDFTFSFNVRYLQPPIPDFLGQKYYWNSILPQIFASGMIHSQHAIICLDNCALPWDSKRGG